MRRVACLFVIAAGLGLSGCAVSTIGSSAGAVAGIASSAVTANPAIGYAVGVGVQAATDATIKYVLREWKNDQQNIMARVAGELAPGQVKQWEIRRTIPYGNERGTIQVVRDIDNVLTPCREILFTVQGKDSASASYLSSLCRNGGQWRWAAAEPSVSRWGGLQ